MGERIENLLPEDIIEEILYKLPVKSLLRFNCVSKRWRSVISSKRFTKQHLKKKSMTTDDTEISHHHVLFSDYMTHKSIGSCSLRSIFHEPDGLGPCSLLRSSEPNIFESSYLRSLATTGVNPIRISDCDIKILGSCNGLILISMTGDKELFIWNPATRQVSNIHPPSFPKKERFIVPWEHFSYGFGYDESTDDYKVVSGIYTALDPQQTQIFSSRTCSWKKIEFSEKSFRISCASYGKFVSRRLHWIEVNKENIRCWEIISLDLAKEKYETVDGPEYLSVHTLSRPALNDLRGYLSLICLSTTCEISVWVMMKYGDSHSWTKIWKLVDFSGLTYVLIPPAMPLWWMKNGEIAVALGSDVLVYNGQDELRKSRVNNLDSIIDSIVYFESLVSPFGDEEHRP